MFAPVNEDRLRCMKVVYGVKEFVPIEVMLTRLKARKIIMVTEQPIRLT